MEARFKHDPCGHKCFRVPWVPELPTMSWLWYKADDFWFKTSIHTTSKLRTEACARFLNYELEQCRMWVDWVLKLALLHSCLQARLHVIFITSAILLQKSLEPAQHVPPWINTAAHWKVTTCRRQHRCGETLPNGSLFYLHYSTLSICGLTGLSQTLFYSSANNEKTSRPYIILHE